MSISPANASPVCGTLPVLFEYHPRGSYFANTFLSASFAGRGGVERGRGREESRGGRWGSVQMEVGGGTGGAAGRREEDGGWRRGHEAGGGLHCSRFTSR